MKKIVLCLSLVTFGTAFSQDCSEIFISEYVEGTGNDKALELYNPTGASISLSGYSIERFSNGSSTSTSGGVLMLSGTIAAHDAFVIVNGQTVTSGSSPACSPALQALADQLDGVYPAPTYMNGNDAIVLFKNSVAIDYMGKTGDAAMTTGSGWGDEFPYDGSVGAVWTENHTLIRKSSVLKGITVNPDPFIVDVEWDSLPKDTWTNLGTHVCDCPLGLEEDNATISFVVFPNPSNTGFTNIVSSEAIETVQIIDLTGSVVFSKKSNEMSKTELLNTADLNKGMYVIKIGHANGTLVQTNLIIQ